MKSCAGLAYHEMLHDKGGFYAIRAPLLHSQFGASFPFHSFFTYIFKSLLQFAKFAIGHMTLPVIAAASSRHIRFDERIVPVCAVMIELCSARTRTRVAQL